MTIISTTVGRNPLEEMELPLWSTKVSEIQYLDAISKMTNDLCFQGKSFNIIVIQVYTQTSNAEDAEVERFYEDLQDLLELTPKKDVLFIIGKVKVKSLSHVRLFATQWTVAHQAPPSMGFSRQEYWSGLPFPSPSL